MNDEADVKRYAQLRIDAASLDAESLSLALEKARSSDAPEIEALRDAVFNDVVTEFGRGDCVVPLRWSQKMIATLS